MTHDEFRANLIARLEDEFGPGKSHVGSGNPRCHLLPEDCRYIVDVVYSAIGRSGFALVPPPDEPRG